MTDPVIGVWVSSNENATGPERVKALQKEIMRHPERWDFGWDDPELGLDLLFRAGEREIRVELKTEPDWLGSAEAGHLYAQKMKAASYDHPAFVAVLGTNMGVLECIPKVTKQSGFLTPKERAGYEAGIERWEAACFASGFPVHYFHGSVDNSMRRICRWARAYVLEETDGLPRPKSDSWPKWCLLGLKNVGPGRAEAILSQGVRPALLGPDGREVTCVEDLLAPGVGRKTAASVLKEVTEYGR